MDLAKLSDNLRKLKKVSNTKNVSMFERLDVSRYENVSSKMLEFLLNSEEEHGIGNLAIIALLEEAKITVEYEPKTLECMSEVHATSDKFDGRGFIDLVVKLQDCTLVIENKIRHILNNPFEIYQEYAKATYTKKNGYSGNDKFIILGIKKPKICPKNFKFVSHENFCKNLKTKINGNFEQSKRNKYHYFILDYIEAIENMSNTKINQEKEDLFNFISENYEKLDYLLEQKKSIIDVSKDKLNEIIELLENKCLFANEDILINDSKLWSDKGVYIWSSELKNIFNGTSIHLVLNVFVRGIIISIAMNNNRKNNNSIYTQEKTIEVLKESQLIKSSVEQLYFNTTIIEKIDYSDGDLNIIASKVDRLIEKIKKFEFTK